LTGKIHHLRNKKSWLFSDRFPFDLKRFLIFRIRSDSYLISYSIVSYDTFKTSTRDSRSESRPVVSVVKIKNDNVDYAVRHAIDLLGGIKTISKDKERKMLKPDLVGPEPRDVTKPGVIMALAQLRFICEEFEVQQIKHTDLIRIQREKRY